MIKYSDITGWFDFEDVYDHVVKTIQDNSSIVEVGACYGKSTAYMASLLVDHKSILFYTVDNWPNNQHYREFVRNMISCGVNQYIKPIRAPSKIAALMFPDESLEFVMVDADHKYTSVVQDILSWEPKVKPGGLMGFHDIHLCPVRTAIDDLIGLDKIEIWEKTGLYKKPKIL